MDARDPMTRAEDYVFGLMSEQERARAERDMEIDPEFRECVTVLAERLRKLHRAKGAAPMSDSDWNEITAHITRMPQMAGNDMAARLAALGMPVADPDAKGMLRIKRPGAQQLAGWRGTVIAGALIAALATGYFVGQASAPPPQPVAAAFLAAEDGLPAAMIEIYGNGSLRFLPLAGFDVPAGKVAQLWAEQEGLAIPLGVLRGIAEATLQGPEVYAPAPGQGVRITLEDAPGSSSGRPSGPVLLTGEAVAPAR